MKLPGGDLDVAFTPLELEATPYGKAVALRLEVQLSTTWFSVRKDVWVDRGDWDQFVAALHVLNDARRGEAVLGDLSQSEMRFRLFTIDRAGHVGADVQLGKAGRPEWHISIRGAELDTEWLSQFVREAATAIDELEVRRD